MKKSFIYLKVRLIKLIEISPPSRVIKSPVKCIGSFSVPPIKLESDPIIVILDLIKMVPVGVNWVLSLRVIIIGLVLSA